MKNYRNYFEKNGFVYGVSSKYEFGKWHRWVSKFTSLEKAEEWLRTEQGDFRESELMSKTAAEKLCGKAGIQNAPLNFGW